MLIFLQWPLRNLWVALALNVHIDLVYVQLCYPGSYQITTWGHSHLMSLPASQTWKSCKYLLNRTTLCFQFHQQSNTQLRLARDDRSFASWENQEVASCEYLGRLLWCSLSDFSKISASSLPWFESSWKLSVHILLQLVHALVRRSGQKSDLCLQTWLLPQIESRSSFLN